MVVKLSGFSS